MADFMDRYTERMASKFGHRSDLYLADYQVLTQASARLLVGWSQQFKAPEQKDIETFVLKNFEGKCKPILASLRHYTAEGATELVVDLYAPSRPMDDAKQMTMIHASMYIAGSDVWEVQRGADNKPFLRRKSEEDITSILQAKEKNATTLYRSASTRSGRIRFAQLKTAGHAVPTPGDRGKFYADGQVLFGTVSSVKATGEIIMQAEGGGKYTIAKEALLEITEKGEASRAEMEKVMDEYFATIYGPDLAKQITRTTPTGTPEQ